MKKLIIGILSIFLLISMLTACDLNSKNTNVTINKPKEEKIVIDKTTFDSYSLTLLKAMRSSLKNEKDLDNNTKNDITEYLNKYHSDDFYHSKLSTSDTHKSEVVFLTSISLKYFFEAKKINDKQSMTVEKKCLNDLLAEYNI